MNEWTFTGQAASMINQIANERPDLPFRKAVVEERSTGKLKRRDLTLYDDKDKIILTGEVKLPDSPDGRTPFQEGLVIDAHTKANNEGVSYFFTWNINRCVLWKTFEQGKPIIERYIENFELSRKIRSSQELYSDDVQNNIRDFLRSFLERSAAIITGTQPMLWLPLDEKFIVIWEAALDPLVLETQAAVESKYADEERFKTQLDAWMRDEQGWTISSKDEELIRENLERAAKFSCYVIANKILFYKALRRKFTRMPALRIPANIVTGEQLREHLQKLFGEATKISKDYETVFASDFGDTLPALTDEAVDSWKLLNKETDAFDFTQINYEIIGQIFERMLSGDERHRFGQHYTRSDIVDLINSFCIRNAGDRVLDPACGGGTFLVRAYDRKQSLAAGALSHDQLIDQIFGLDISTYPVHLTTINLATRDLVQGNNYPLVARKDFFTLEPGGHAFHIPAEHNGKKKWVSLPQVDCVVGNPPYVRHEKIDEYYGSGYKTHLLQLALHESSLAKLSGRSDILCFFFVHAYTFVREGGYVGLLTSSSWLDSAYGFRLQEFVLANFQVVAVMESSCEPWFTGARVTTTATILRREIDPDKRAANQVRFVWLKKELSQFFATSDSEEQRRERVDHLRDKIEAQSEWYEDGLLRIRVVKQDNLYLAGCDSDIAENYGEEEETVEEEGDEAADSEEECDAEEV